MRKLFVKIKSNWSNLIVYAPNKFQNLEDVLSEAPESEGYDYNGLYSTVEAHPESNGDDFVQPINDENTPRVRFDNLNMMKDRLNAILDKKNSRSPVVSAKRIVCCL